MSLRIFNTLTGIKEEFHSIKSHEVNMYVCGVTVYDLCHLGHARGAIVFDVIRNYLEYRGYKVRYIRNFTDIDDKIIKKAGEEGKNWREIAENYIEEYYRDMESLKVKKATREPRATEHITQMINIIQTLLDRGYAYQFPDGDIYFAVEKYPDYGKLSRRNLNEMLAGARVEVDDKKQNPLDFVLWKRSKPGEPLWPSSWGEGRPGWHIECSAMSLEYLGESLDIHGGGMDLIFPHHENEIAQSEAFTCKPFARYWIHNGFVNINQEKMSKSLGNYFTIREILKTHKPETIRFFLLSTQYRNSIDFSLESLSQSKKGLDRFYTMLQRLDGYLGEDAHSETNYERESKGRNSNQKLDGFSKKEAPEKMIEPPLIDLSKELEKLPGVFGEAMDDDFNTALAISRLFDMSKTVNSCLDRIGMVNEKSKAVLVKSRQIFHKLGEVLGLFQISPKEWFQTREDQCLEVLDQKTIKRMITERNEARKQKNWDRADRIRENLAKMGVILEDSPQGTSWKYKH